MWCLQLLICDYLLSIPYQINPFYGSSLHQSVPIMTEYYKVTQKFEQKLEENCHIQVKAMEWSIPPTYPPIVNLEQFSSSLKYMKGMQHLPLPAENKNMTIKCLLQALHICQWLCMPIRFSSVQFALNCCTVNLTSNLDIYIRFKNLNN